MNKTPTVLVIMDGFGMGTPGPGNAVALANTPVLDRLFAENAHTTLSASGLDVGLPAGQMGNSEVGHTNIGGGRVVFQDLPRISRAIETGEFFKNPAYNKAMDDCLAKGSSLHLYGLLSNGGVHSTVEHLWALLKMAKDKGLTRVYIHAFLDGRDVSPTSGKGFVAECVEKCRELGVGKIATVMGRYYAMDRDKRWERLQMAYDAMVYGEGVQNPDPVAAVAQSYENGVTDEFVEPVVCDSEGTISNNDSIIFFNYRPDRAREITRAMVDPEFDGFPRECFPTTYVCNTEYDASMPNVLVAWPRIAVKNGLGEYLSSLGLTQLRIAETEKYAHVTFFFNGGVETQYPGEDRVLVASPKVATYALQPEMSAYEVCDKCVERIKSGAYDVVILNFARDLLVDDEAMAEALASGKVSRYVTDFPNDRTASMPGCIAIPHLGASTEESEDNCAKMAVSQVMNYLENGNIVNSVNFPNCDMGVCASQGRITILHRNIPNSLGRFTTALAGENVNIAGLMNKSRGEYAYTMLDLDHQPSRNLVEGLKKIDGVLRVRVIR